MHLVDLDVGFMGATPIVGGTVPLAVGSAWAASLKGTHDVTVSFLGDGCFEEGVVHESMNFSALHRLPIIFVCENNDFSVYTRRDERQPHRPIYRIAEAHGMPAAAADGNDVEMVNSLVRTAVENARNGRGPQFLEFDAYRWREHCGPDFDDHLKYRSVQEIESGMNNCPIDRYKKVLMQSGFLDQQACAGIEAQIREEVSAAFEFALASSKPTIKDAWEKVYA